MIDTDDCWLYAGPTNPHDYGLIKGGKAYGAHRAMYEHFVGPIPEGLEIDHLCSVRRCVNISHLEAVTHEENMRRGRVRRVTCRRGHKMSGDNLNIYVWDKLPDVVTRSCNTCRRMGQKRRYYQRKLMKVKD